MSGTMHHVLPRIAWSGYLSLGLGFLFAPVAAAFVFSFSADRFPTLPMSGLSLQWYAEALADPKVWEAAGNTVLVAVVNATIATALGFAAAYADIRFRFIGKRLVLVAALLPPTIPLVIMGLAMLAYLSRIGLSGTLTSIVICHVVLSAPFAMAVCRLRLSQMDQSLEAAAHNLGAPPWVAFREIVLPFAWPGILAAFFLTLAVSFDEFAVAWFVGGLNETIPVRILSTLQGQVSPVIHAIGTMTFAVSMALILISQYLLRYQGHRTSPGQSNGGEGNV
jgi:spermidine/putrescine transport system permease protein